MCESTVSEEPIDADDLLEDPRTDAEALCLCGLLWAPADAAQQVVAVLTAEDFPRPIYGELFETIAAHVRAGTLHDPASIAAHLAQTGKAAGHHGTLLSRALSEATTAGAGPEAAGHYARAVVAAAYRRGVLRRRRRHHPSRSRTSTRPALQPPAEHRPRTPHRHRTPGPHPHRAELSGQPPPEGGRSHPVKG